MNGAMIAADLMHPVEDIRIVRRRHLRRTIIVILGVAAINTAIVTVVTPAGLTSLPVTTIANLLFSNCIGWLFWLFGPVVRIRTASMKPAVAWTLRIVCWAAMTNAGALLAFALLSPFKAFQMEEADVVRQILFPATIITVICVACMTIYESLKYKSQYETAQARLSSLESRLRPHFLFNTLNSISALIPEDPVAAETMTVRLAALLRSSLDSSHRNTVPLEDELKLTIDYLEIEKTRFDSRLHYSVDVPPELLKTEVPPFSLQTLVENSVKYGGSEIRLSAAKNNGRLMLNVWDSGSGFPDNGALTVGHGLHNLRSRLEALWGSDATLEFPHDSVGTTVRILLPAGRRQ